MLERLFGHASVPSWVMCFDAGAIVSEYACMGCCCALMLELLFGYMIACIGC